MKKYLFIIVLGSTLVFTACSGDKKNNSNANNSVEESADNIQAEKLELVEIFSPSFDEAKLILKNELDGSKIMDGKATFSFDVEDYALRDQTSDAATKGLANSHHGQHIHLILNNGPYSAHYDSDVEMELEDGHYVYLAFLSRSYHESVKTKDAYVVGQFSVGSGEYDMENLERPHLIYSRPKGDYSGVDTENLLLDFYLLNCDLSPDGYKVLADINGQEFTITKWAPYAIKGLAKGKVDIKLTLVDKDGSVVVSPFNPSVRSVNLLD